MAIATPTRLSTIIVNLSDVVIRGIDDDLITKLAQGNVGISLKPIKDSAFCDPAALNVFTEAAKGLGASGDDYLKAVIKAGDWKISLEDLRNAVTKSCRDEVPGMKVLLQELRSKGLYLILESNHIREWIEDIKAHHAFLDDVFDDQVFSFDTGRLNKDFGAFAEIAGRSGKSLSECLYIGNSSRICKVAEEAGIQVIEFQGVATLRQHLSALDLI